MFRKLLTPTVVLFYLLTSCSPASESSENADSLAMMADTTTVQDVFEEDESNEGEGADTTLLTDIKSAFSSPQINTRIAFVYRRDGLPVYKSLEDTSDPANAVSSLDFGSKITLVEALVNNQPSDKVMFEGFKGRYIPFQSDNGVLYIFSGYLTNFPVPQKSDGLLDYFSSNFHLVSPPVQVTSKAMFDDNIPEWSKTQYKMESDIIVDDDGYYEGSSMNVTLPASCTMQEGFLLLRSFEVMTPFDSVFNTYPPVGFSKNLDEYRSGTVESNDQDGIIKIILEDNSGCYDGTYVEKTEGRVVIGSGGGC